MALSNEIEGTVIYVAETQEIGTSGFRKKEFALKVEDGQYPQEIAFEITQDNIDKHGGKLSEGAEITVHYNLRGRRWVSPKGETRFFNTLVCWRIDGETVAALKAVAAAPIEGNSDIEEDELPF